MRSSLIIAVFLVLSFTAAAQSSLRGVVKDFESGLPLAGANANIKKLGIGTSTNENGEFIIPTVPAGEHQVEFSFVGFEAKKISIRFPADTSSVFEVLLQRTEEELQEVVIVSTRSSRTIADIPTRIEFIAGEELDEKGNMKPGDIRMLLNESTGIQTQQTSATSANASIRIQGLDGRYTQILKDGFPLYAGFSGGLGLLQTPPLDLKQVEVIKGSSSTLYGGGAIAGMVNLISRTPSEDRDLRFLVNATSAKGLDLSGFYAEDFGTIGLTVFASRNSNEAYDPADIGLSAIPEFERYTLNPKIFVDFNEQTMLSVGFNFTGEDRMGGDTKFIKGNGDAIHSYFESNESKRFSSQVLLRRELSERSSFTLKNSINRFDRRIRTPGYLFDGIQNSTFSELNYTNIGDKSEWIAGVNLWTDDFRENEIAGLYVRDYTQTTLGVFIQNTATFSETWSLETGLRGDYVMDYGGIFLPRFSLLYKASETFSSRLGGGFGYKAPTVFTEESERMQYRFVLPISSSRNVLEKSYGANWDLNYHTQLGDAELSLNHLFFLTYLDNPLVLSPAGDGLYAFFNLSGHTESKGTETNVKLAFGNFKLFIGYTFTDTKIRDRGASVENALTAKHRLNNVLMYEVEETWKVGLEAYYFSKQRLTDGTFGKQYWICGFMVERLWEKFSLFLNFENFLDTRQSRFDIIYTGSITDPVFKDIYAPMDGFVINGGIKLAL